MLLFILISVKLSLFFGAGNIYSMYDIIPANTRRVYNVGPTLNQHWTNVSRLLGLTYIFLGILLDNMCTFIHIIVHHIILYTVHNNALYMSFLLSIISIYHIFLIIIYFTRIYLKTFFLNILPVVPPSPSRLNRRNDVAMPVCPPL